MLKYFIFVIILISSLFGLISFATIFPHSGWLVAILITITFYCLNFAVICFIDWNFKEQNCQVPIDYIYKYLKSLEEDESSNSEQ